MNKIIDFERMIFGSSTEFKYIDVHENEFLVNCFIKRTKIRAFQLEETVDLCKKYLFDKQFRQNLLIGCSLRAPVLVHILYRANYYSLDETIGESRKKERYLFCYYFKKNLNDFEDLIQEHNYNSTIDMTPYNDDAFLELAIECGFHPTSIEYCIKYDELCSLNKILQNPLLKNVIEAEWITKPASLDLLSFAGYYGSIKCFRQLMLCGYVIDDDVKRNVICSGSHDLIRIIQQDSFEFNNVFYAVEYCHPEIVQFMCESNGTVNITDSNGS